MRVFATVPCGSEQAYQNSDWGRWFTTIQCEEVGIGVVDDADVRVWSADGRIIVNGVEGREVAVYDMTGRQVGTSGLCSGVYLVRVEGLPARKVVVMRD